MSPKARARIALGITLVGGGVALAFVAPALSGGTIVALALLLVGGLVLYPMSSLRRENRTTTVVVEPAEAGTPELMARYIDAQVRLFTARSEARRAETRATDAERTAAALTAYALGASADDAMRAFRAA